MRNGGDETLPEDMEISTEPEATNGGIMNERAAGAEAPQWFGAAEQEQAYRLEALRLALGTLGDEAEPADVLATAKDYINFVITG